MSFLFRAAPKAMSDPDVWWKANGAAQTVKTVTPADGKTPQAPNTVRFVCLSDTHNLASRIKYLPAGDVLLHAGDFTDVGSLSDIVAFNDWLGKQTQFKHKIVIAGNHDLSLDETSWMKDTNNYARFGGKHKYGAKEFTTAQARAAITNCTYLFDSETTVFGYRIWGTPWQPRFFDWGFNLDRGADCKAKWDLIPSGTDIVMSHGPPIGHGDLCHGNKRAGCVDLLQTLQNRVKPLVHVFGHIHEGWGQTTDGKIQYINASTCDLSYSPEALNPPIVFDLPVREAATAAAPAAASTAATAAAASGDSKSGK